ncbi:MAG: alpha-amylase family glycosyl hydrolase [candidate division KSB1 bacterium]|nr:alpha-amylase family glycosyl hydrolase [candidate division KSB1 bacterium]MDZ7274830.1 alpha-amylase family glycosyl hydrolase [candidate division KSB1 bacterium]MDZ7288197.1 alpha-amylase family glycosyl hydrolase [candidate division KSB1 bacterium]MDZ7300422.1 alpha-amylase family glycosyl hydrolase [candidate division KSB1 bacterium]MDZ7308123.1 alpha-amylase family glycosyl hydrolase [candidate division KSB1 bacterium]
MCRLRLPVLTAVLLLLLSPAGRAQSDSVDVFFYYKPTGNPSVVFLPGEFNNWGPNSSGVIAPNAPSRMTFNAAAGRWEKTVRLRVGGPASGGRVPGAYQYKFNENGTSSGWRSDPLNPRQNPSDFNNSILYVKSPTIHYLLPNAVAGVVKARLPRITAYIFPSRQHALDPASLRLEIDGTAYTNLESFYDPNNKLLSFTPATPLSNGRHTLKLSVRNTAGSLTTDSTTFEVLGDVVQILTQPATTRKASWRVRGEVYQPDGSLDHALSSGVLYQNELRWRVSMNAGKFDTTLALLEGDNSFRFEAAPGGVVHLSSPVLIKRLVDHRPVAVITFDTSRSDLRLQAFQSTDPDPGQAALLQFTWQEDADNPALLGVNGQSGAVVTVNRPRLPGEYFFTLTARDPDGNQDWSRQFVTVAPSGEITLNTARNNPAWVRQARIYIMFFKGLTAAGTIKAALPFLERIKALGFSVLWVLPVMDNAFPIDNRYGIGYNIVDFYNVAPEYGSNQDFKDFIVRAHELGLKVILDFTPNHSSRFHPFAEHARLHGIDSPYWPFYQHSNIPHNTNGLGQSADAFGFYYYSGFSEQLLNWDWSDLDARSYMLEVMQHWLLEFNLDGYRLDVYWGPHRRYGETLFDRPLRAALKKIKPDLLLLGEDDGTGPGTEVIYADRDGGVDAAYDFKLYFNQIRSFGFSATAVNNLHNELLNGEFYPGTNSHYFRFMETQDEDRITYRYDSFEKTMPMASVLFTAPGLPGIMQGQEVGYGKGLPGDEEDRVRRVVDFNFSGRALLLPHYQKLAHIRAQFPAFHQHKQDTNRDFNVNSSDEPDFIRVNTGDGLVYAFARPYPDHNGLTVVNFAAAQKSVTLDLTAANLLKFTGGLLAGGTYYLNDLYNDTQQTVSGAALAAVNVTLPASGTAIFVISKEAERVQLPPITSVVENPGGDWPAVFALSQNYPNPFNPATKIVYDLPQAGHVTIRIFDVLGREVVTLFDGWQPAGRHSLLWQGRDAAGHPAGSGIYLLRVEAGENMAVKKMLLAK